MPLYVCFCPDYPNNGEKRLAARPKHLEMGKASGENGEKVFGRAYLDDQSNMAGSCMIYRFETIEQAWSRIKADPYWTEDVWDKEKLVIKELAAGPTDATASFS